MIDVRRTAPAPIETVTPIKPSEAIRLGCLTTMQTFGAIGGDGTACVMGAMYIGYGAWDGKRVPLFTGWENNRPACDAFAAVASLQCPVVDCDTPETWKTGPAHLNDDHRWSRERIADWLEGLGL